jgi:DNA-binding response OmpR family regulator
VLVLDDHPVSLDVLRWILESKGFVVLSAADADSAAAHAEEYKVDLLIADVHLRSARSGTELALKLRETRPDLPVLFTSGTPIEGWADIDFLNLKTLSEAAIDFIPKPFTADALVARVKDLLAGRRGEIRAEIQEAEGFRMRQARSAGSTLR